MGLFRKKKTPVVTESNEPPATDEDEADDDDTPAPVPGPYRIRQGCGRAFTWSFTGPFVADHASMTRDFWEDMLNGAYNEGRKQGRAERDAELAKEPQPQQTEATN